MLTSRPLPMSIHRQLSAQSGRVAITARADYCLSRGRKFLGPIFESRHLNTNLGKFIGNGGFKPLPTHQFSIQGFSIALLSIRLLGRDNVHVRMISNHFVQRRYWAIFRPSLWVPQTSAHRSLATMCEYLFGINSEYGFGASSVNLELIAEPWIITDFRDAIYTKSLSNRRNHKENSNIRMSQNVQ